MWSAAVVSALGVAVVLLVHSKHAAEVADDPLRARRLASSSTRTAAAALFPTALLALVPSDDRASPTLLVPLAWMAGAWALDSYLVHHGTSTSPDTVPASLRLDPTSVTALSFGLCSLVGARSDGRYTHLILYAVIGCIVGVLPSHNLEPESAEAGHIEDVQKALLMWCVGLLLAGVSLARTAPECQNEATA